MWAVVIYNKEYDGLSVNFFFFFFGYVREVKAAGLCFCLLFYS